MLGTEATWPAAGEIDIIEAINDMDTNQVALHTPSGCYQADAATQIQSGTTEDTDCSTDSGCLVRETKANSYGPGFAAAGGGVYAIELDVSGIFVWFFSVCRSSFFFPPCSHTISLAAQHPGKHSTSNRILSNRHDHLGSPHSSVPKLCGM